MHLRKLLLVCGVLASLLYVGIDVLSAIFYPEYHSFSAVAISELMATGAPTERLVDPLFVLYDLLMIAFGVGLWMSSSEKRAHVTSVLLVTYATLGLLGPTYFEMNMRGAGAMNQDLAHIAMTAVLVLIIFAIVSVGASILSRAFRLYSYATLSVMLVFGVLTSIASRGLSTGQPTPWLGITERIDIGAFLLWVALMSIALLRAPRQPAAVR
jgi:hypothetical protein